jgi:hypothetical protein
MRFFLRLPRLNSAKLKDWKAENSFIVANQPKGSMELKAKIELRSTIEVEGHVVSEKQTIGYADLFILRTSQEQTVNQIAGDLRDYAEVAQPRELIS